MTLKEDMASEVGWFLDLDEFADLVTIGGESYPALVDHEDSPADPPAGAGQVDRAVITISQTALPAPAYRTPITVGSTTWYVVSWKEMDGMWELTCIANERVAR